MASRKQSQVQPDAEASKTEAAGYAPGGIEETERDVRFAVARIADEAIGFWLDDIAEIIRMPRLAHMPLAPQSLLGLGNLRGRVLPVISLRRLLGFADIPIDGAARVVVIGSGSPVGFAIDRVDSLRTVPVGAIETNRAGAGRLNPVLVAGVVKGGEGENSIKILNPERLLRDEFKWLRVSETKASASTAIAADIAAPVRQPERQVSLVSLGLGRQEYALPLDRVREIIRMPEHVSEVAGAETAVLGVVTLRDHLLPLVSLRALLGLPTDERHGERGKIVVLSLGNTSVGVVTDRTNEVLHVNASEIDPAPALLTRGDGDAEIESICRLDGGRRLVALLSPDRLFRSDLVRRVLSEAGPERILSEYEAAGGVMTEEQFIIFRLGDQEYGLPVTAVDEVARLPERITRLPKAPSLIDGVINLRGTVVPIVDLRRRFDLISEEPRATRRILVLAVGGGQTGFIVDGVSEVLKISTHSICAAPELSSEQMRLIGRVANLEAQGRIILLVDPERLLDKLEADTLSKFDRSQPDSALNAS